MKLKVTWKLIIYGFVLVLSAAPAVLVNSPAGYMPVLTVLLCGILCFVWIIIVRSRLNFDAVSEGFSCTRGDESQFQVHVENNSFLPVTGFDIEFFISDSDGNDSRVSKLYMTLAPGEVRDFSFDAGFPHIGVYRAGIRKVELKDPLGIFAAVRSDEKSYSLEILPNIVQVRELPVSTNVQTESVKSAVQSPLSGSDYTGVREYAFGDPIKSIHWKLSAHAGCLMTKQTESYSNTGLSIILDMTIPEGDGSFRLDEFDTVIEAGASCGNFARENGLDYDMMFYRRDGSVARVIPSSFREMNGVIREFHLSRPDSSKDITTLLDENCRGVYSQANICVCTTHADEALTNMLASLKQSGRTPILFLVLSEGLTERERDNRMAKLRPLQYSNIACRVISQAAELQVGL